MSVAPELQREREHLARARAELARMREQTLSLEAHGGDRVSSEFLAATLHRRAQSLVDDPTSTLFFGRIDRSPTAVAGAPTPPAHRPPLRSAGTSAAGTWPTTAGDPVVIDWRAEVSRAFYRAIAHRRRWASGCAAGSASTAGTLTAYEDEHLDRPGRGDRGERHPGQRDRAPARGADARHRRDHPARAGRRSSAPTSTDDHLRAGRARHRQDGGRAAPRGVAALRVPRAAGPRRRPGRSARTGRSSTTSAPCCRPSARSRCATRPSRSCWPACRSAASTARKPLCSRATRAWPRCCTGPCGRTSAAPPSRSSCRAARTAGGSRPTRWPTSSRSCAPVASATRPRARCCRTGSPTRCSCGWSGRATPPTTGCRTPWRARPWSDATPATVWPALDPRTVLFGLLGDHDALARAADGLLDDDEQRLLRWSSAPQEPRRRTVVGGRRGAAGRDPRPPRAHAQPRPRGARRGAGPLTDAAACGRPALLDRLGDGARRHRPGHDAVGDRLLGVLVASPGQGRRTHRDPRPRFPRAGHGHRVRRAAAAGHGSRPRRPRLRP